MWQGCGNLGSCPWGRLCASQLVHTHSWCTLWGNAVFSFHFDGNAFDISLVDTIQRSSSVSNEPNKHYWNSHVRLFYYKLSMWLVNVQNFGNFGNCVILTNINHWETTPQECRFGNEVILWGLAQSLENLSTPHILLWILMGTWDRHIKVMCQNWMYFYPKRTNEINMISLKPWKPWIMLLSMSKQNYKLNMNMRR